MDDDHESYPLIEGSKDSGYFLDRSELWSKHAASWRRCCSFRHLRLVLGVVLCILATTSIVILSRQSAQTATPPEKPIEPIIATPTEIYNATLLNSLWPAAEPDRMDSWRTANSKSLHSLLSCMAQNNCGQNQTSIVLVTARHFAWVLEWTQLSGEQIWAKSVMIVLREMGYTMIFAPDVNELSRIYPLFPDLVKTVLIEDFQVDQCWKDSQCIKSPDNLLGVPAWKMLTFSFWQGSDNPLGSPWTVGPENWAQLNPWTSAENVYMGYSVERSCRKIPVVAFNQRPHRVYILAKQLSYFYESEFPWQNMTFNASDSVSFVGGITDNTEGKHILPDGITSYGLLKQEQFYAEVANSRAMLGIGNPAISPSPYDALCLGVPFINPILHWNTEDPDNRDGWGTQHDGLRYEKPPYVYHVKFGDVDGLWSAINEAMNNPIDRYILPTMTMDALRPRVGEIIERDWRGKAEALLATRKKTGEGQVRHSFA
ncbi:hypothetical protein C8J56DRAFT_870189 [Mycena floridula]|nr:hypothetical protein C8J56DRAFT_870189 [Mycena floridula]